MFLIQTKKLPIWPKTDPRHPISKYLTHQVPRAYPHCHPRGPTAHLFLFGGPPVSNYVTPVIFDPLLPVLTSLFFAAVLFSDRTDRAELGQTAEAD